MEPRWIFNVSEIQHEGSAILGGNKLVFYTIQIVAVVEICLSLIASMAVVVSILCRKEDKSIVPTSATKRSNNQGFTERFPLYLAVADICWISSHFIDHFLLLVTQTFPSANVSFLLGVNLSFFGGYQQALQVYLAVYAYLKIVKEMRIDMGRYEWKLHLIGLCTCIVITATGVVSGTFGPSGFWILYNAGTREGLVILWIETVVITSNAILIALIYKRISEVVLRQKGVMSNCANFKAGNPYSTASKCLTTFIFVSLVIYCPISVTLIIAAIESYVFGILDPVTPFVHVIFANIIGTANAIAYFYNRQLKFKAKQLQAGTK